MPNCKQSCDITLMKQAEIVGGLAQGGINDICIWRHPFREYRENYMANVQIIDFLSGIRKKEIRSKLGLVFLGNQSQSPC